MRLPRRLPGWPGARPAALAAVFGALAAAGQAPLGWWPVTLVALAALIRLVALMPGPGAAAWIGLIGGAAHFAAAMTWIVEPFLVDPARHAWMIPFAVVLLNAGLGLFWAAAAAASALSRHRLAAFAVALAAAELARGYVLTGFPWALPGHVWVDTPVAQTVALAGPYALTLATLLGAAGLAALRPLPAALGLALVAAGWGWGSWRLAQPEPPAPGVTIRLVQPNAAQDLKWDPDLARDHFERLIANTALPPRPDLTIWPETALPYLIDEGSMLPDIIAQAGQGAPVLIGFQRVEGDRAWNSLGLVTPDGQIALTYDKHHLVPFGEYIPMGDLAFDWFGIRAFASQAGAGYSPGPAAVTLDLGPRLGRALPLICYEAVFPQSLRVPGPRAGWIIQATNDAWFGTLTGPWQHFAQARFRAIEQGLPLARAANTGITAMVDARGRVTAELPFATEGRLDATLPGTLPPPPYARWGETPLLLVLVLLALWVWRPRRAKA